MTPKIYLFVCSFLFVSLVGLNCKYTSSTSQKQMYRSIYLDQFKLTYFKQMLVKSYNNSKSIQEIIGADNSGFTEPILTADDYRLIDSLTSVDNDKMKIDSTEGNRRAEGAQGKRPLSFILDKLNGKWLDSLANERHMSSEVKDFHRY